MKAQQLTVHMIDTAILVVWSPDVTPSTLLLFSQTIPILVATLSSIHSTNMSLFDAHFSAAAAASPLSIYVSASSVLYLFRPNGTSLFEKIPSHKARTLILIMGLILPLLWLSVSLVTSFSTIAFRNSGFCRGMTFPRYFEFVLVSSFTGVLDVLGRRDIWDDLSKRWGLGLISLVGMWIWAVYLVRHREEIARECFSPMQDIKLQKGLRKRHLRLAMEYLLLVWRVPKVSW